MGTEKTAAIAPTIIAAMDAKSVTQVDLSNSTGIPRPTLQRKLQGFSSFTIDELDVIAAQLGLDLASLVGAAA